MPISDVDYLRLLLDDREDRARADRQDTYFDDDQIAELLSRTSNDLYYAAAVGWAVKAADYAELIDTSETGSTRQLSQMYKHANEQSNKFLKLSEFNAGGGGPGNNIAVVARAVSLRERSSTSLPFDDQVIWFRTRRVAG